MTQLDLKKYYNICLDERQALSYPPFSWIVRLEGRGKSKNTVEEATARLKSRFKNTPKGIEILGPAYCYREKLRDYYRMQIVLKSKKQYDPNGGKLHAYYKSIIKRNNGANLKGGLRLIVDVNPVSLL